MSIINKQPGVYSLFYLAGKEAANVKNDSPLPEPVQKFIEIENTHYENKFQKELDLCFVNSNISDFKMILSEIQINYFKSYSREKEKFVHTLEFRNKNYTAYSILKILKQCSHRIRHEYEMDSEWYKILGRVLDTVEQLI